MLEWNIVHNLIVLDASTGADFITHACFPWTRSMIPRPFILQWSRVWGYRVCNIFTITKSTPDKLRGSSRRIEGPIHGKISPMSPRPGTIGRKKHLEEQTLGSLQNNFSCQREMVNAHGITLARDGRDWLAANTAPRRASQELVALFDNQLSKSRILANFSIHLLCRLR